MAKLQASAVELGSFVGAVVEAAAAERMMPPLLLVAERFERSDSVRVVRRELDAVWSASVDRLRISDLDAHVRAVRDACADVDDVAAEASWGPGVAVESACRFLAGQTLDRLEGIRWSFQIREVLVAMRKHGLYVLGSRNPDLPAFEAGLPNEPEIADELHRIESDISALRAADWPASVALVRERARKEAALTDWSAYFA